MTEVASLELCKELYELSGWDDTDLCWAGLQSYDGTEEVFLTAVDTPELGHDIYRISYAYSLGYLLRKLPHHHPIERNGMTGNWIITRNVRFPKAEDKFWGETPEDAACKLAIELFKQGILKP